MLVIKRARKERGWSGCEGESEGGRRALGVGQLERLPFRASVERQGHGPCLSEFPLISWKICKLASSHRSSDILGALQRIILKMYNKVIEGPVCQSAATEALGTWEPFLKPLWWPRVVEGHLSSCEQGYLCPVHATGWAAQSCLHFLSDCCHQGRIQYFQGHALAPWSPGFLPLLRQSAGKQWGEKQISQKV